MCKSDPDPPGEDGVLEEIARRVEATRESGGTSILPPLLLLGVIERVGSNWVSDTLRSITGQHNEPFRQQVSAAHPLSALNPAIMSLEASGPQLGHYGRHWLVTFAVGKYTPVRQVIKETNLFFALPALLALFPDSPVVLLTRSPLGVASSFVRGDLFRRWDYRTRYRQMVAITSRAEFCQWAKVVPDDDPSELAALARLQILNTLLLASALHDRVVECAVIRYETAVLDPAAACARLARLVPEAPGLGALPGMTATMAAQDTFVTATPKTTLTARLTSADAEQVRAAVAGALAVGQQVAPAGAGDLAREWASGGHLYSLTSPFRPASRLLACRASARGGRPCQVRWVPGHSNSDLRLRNLLVTNDEFAFFLNEMADAGRPNCLDGCYLLACEMPHERGGRLHRDHRAGRWTVSPGFGGHPVYWVTWIGAAAFAARHGARLPARSEMITETRHEDLVVTNHGYQVGDTVPVMQPGCGPWEVHHLVGNLQIWCADGPISSPSAPAVRWLHGAAWNTPGTPEEIHRERSRHMSGASRGVGIRLVRDRTGQPTTPARVAAALNGWVLMLADRTQPLSALDGALAGALAALSEPDRGLGSHV